jgi:hypothetical protein
MPAPLAARRSSHRQRGDGYGRGSARLPGRDGPGITAGPDPRLTACAPERTEAIHTAARHGSCPRSPIRVRSRPTARARQAGSAGRPELGGERRPARSAGPGGSTPTRPTANPSPPGRSPPRGPARSVPGRTGCPRTSTPTRCCPALSPAANARARNWAVIAGRPTSTAGSVHRGGFRADGGLRHARSLPSVTILPA